MEKKLGRKENLEKAAKCERRKRPSTPSKRGETFSSEYEHLKKKKLWLIALSKWGAARHPLPPKLSRKKSPFSLFLMGLLFPETSGNEKRFSFRKLSRREKCHQARKDGRGGERERGG